MFENEVEMNQEEIASEYAKTQFEFGHDFYLPNPEKANSDEKVRALYKTAQRIAFLSNTPILLTFFKVGPKDSQVELLDRSSVSIQKLLNIPAEVEPMYANRNNKAFSYWVYPVLYLTGGYLSKDRFNADGTRMWVDQPEVRFFKCSNKRMLGLLEVQKEKLIQQYRTAEESVKAGTLSIEDWTAKGYIPVADLENLILNKPWTEIQGMTDKISKSALEKCALMGRKVTTKDAQGVVEETFHYNVYPISLQGSGATTSYKLGIPVLTKIDFDAMVAVPSKQRPGEVVEVLAIKRPTRNGKWGKAKTGSAADRWFTHRGIEHASPDLSKPGEMHALTVFTYANEEPAKYRPYEGLAPAQQKDVQKHLGAPVESGSSPVAEDDVF